MLLTGGIRKAFVAVNIYKNAWTICHNMSPNGSDDGLQMVYRSTHLDLRIVFRRTRRFRERMIPNQCVLLEQLKKKFKQPSKKKFKQQWKKSSNQVKNSNNQVKKFSQPSNTNYNDIKYSYKYFSALATLNGIYSRVAGSMDLWNDWHAKNVQYHPYSAIGFSRLCSTLIMFKWQRAGVVYNAVKWKGN
jgi:hypothetical protein